MYCVFSKETILLFSTAKRPWTNFKQFRIYFADGMLDKCRQYTRRTAMLHGLLVRISFHGICVMHLRQSGKNLDRCLPCKERGTPPYDHVVITRLHQSYLFPRSTDISYSDLLNLLRLAFGQSCAKLKLCLQIKPCNSSCLRYRALFVLF